MRFVEVKVSEQQATLAIHRTCDLMDGHRIQRNNMLCAQLAKFGRVLPQEDYQALQFAKNCLNGEQTNLPEALLQIVGQFHLEVLRPPVELNVQLKHLTLGSVVQISVRHNSNLLLAKLNELTKRGPKAPFLQYGVAWLFAPDFGVGFSVAVLWIKLIAVT